MQCYRTRRTAGTLGEKQWACSLGRAVLTLKPERKCAFPPSCHFQDNSSTLVLSFVPCVPEPSASLTEFSAEREGVQQVYLVHITLEMWAGSGSDVKGQVKETSQVCGFGSHFLPKSEEVQRWAEQNIGCQLNCVRPTLCGLDIPAV